MEWYENPRNSRSYVFCRKISERMAELQGLVSKEEYQEFLSKCFDVKLETAIEQAENIIKKRG